MTSAGPHPGSQTDPESVDRRHYDESGYFAGGGAHLRDPESPFHRYRVREVLGLCGSVDGARVVDLGCGWGTLSFALARAGGEVVGVDFSRAALDICRERQHAESPANLRFICADAARTGLVAGAWDLVVAADLVEHLYPDQTLDVYREVRRLLGPGGRFVLWTPNPGHLLEWMRRHGILRPDPTHVDYKTMGRTVRDLEACGFTVEDARYAPSHVPILRALERIGQGWMPALRRRIAVVAT